MSKKDEALKLALEALEHISSHYMSLPKIGCMALAAVEEALAEQPPCKTGSQCTSKCEQCRYKYDCDKAEQPAQEQEPVAEHFEKMHANGDVWITTIAAAAIARNTSPQSKPWVGLDETDLAVCDTDGVRLARYWERVLREKNNGTR